MKKFVKLILVLIIPLTLTACKATRLTADTLPYLGGEKILFKDDFSSRTGGWTVHEDSLSASGYSQDGFRIWVNLPHYQFWSVPGLNFQDVILQVDATKLAGPADNLFGLLCRYQDDGNFYAFVIGSDGYYGIYKIVDGKQSLIDQVHLDFSERIYAGDASNQIQAVCQADQLALIVNETKLLQVTDKTFTHGDVGMIAGSFSIKGVEILFDNFIVINPKAQ